MPKEEKTEKATPKKRQDARKKEGMVAKSQDLTTGVLFFAACLVLRVWGPYVFKEIGMLLQGTIAAAGHASGASSAVAALSGGIVRVMLLLAPLVMALGAIAFLITAIQVRFYFTPSAIKFKGNRINVLQGIKRMFSPKTFVELFKSLLKFSLIALVAYLSIKEGYIRLHGMSGAGAAELFATYMNLVFAMAIKVSAVMLLIGGLDYGYQRYEFEKSIRMTKAEIKQEFKQAEGDPNLRGAIRARMRQLARQRMMSDVQKAAFVIANPTHLAIALEYHRGMAAPKVVAKGMNLIALRIIEEAEKHGVPVVEDKPLARAMYKMVEVGWDIPPDLYKAVAEVLAYVMSMDSSIAEKVA